MTPYHCGTTLVPGESQAAKGFGTSEKETDNNLLKIK